MAAFLATLTLTWAAIELIAYRVVGEVGERNIRGGRYKYEVGVLYAVEEAKRNRLGNRRTMGWGHHTEYHPGMDYSNARDRTPLVAPNIHIEAVHYRISTHPVQNDRDKLGLVPI